MIPIEQVSSSSIKPDEIISNETNLKKDTLHTNNIDLVRIKIVTKKNKRKSDHIQEKSSKRTKRSKKNDSNIFIQISFLNKSKSKQLPAKTKSKSSTLSLETLQDEFRTATFLLGKLHPSVIENNNENKQNRQTLLESCGMRESITDSIISTMLSQNTTDKNSKAAWKQLKQKFPTWESVLQLDENDLSPLEKSIKIAGLAKTRALRIYQLLYKCKESHPDNKACFQYLTQMSTNEIKNHLNKFKGLGPKTISCVLLFGLGRAEFPVDTHVLRISKYMDWLSYPSTNKNSEHSRETAYELMNSIVPDDIKMDLHCLLVTHGKQCHNCAANHRPQFPPKDGSKLICPLKKIKQMRIKTVKDPIVKQDLDNDFKKTVPQTVLSHTQIKTEFVQD